MCPSSMTKSAMHARATVAIRGRTISRTRRPHWQMPTCSRHKPFRPPSHTATSLPPSRRGNMQATVQPPRTRAPIHLLSRWAEARSCSMTAALASENSTLLTDPPSSTSSTVTRTGTLTGRTSSRGTSRAAPTPICCSTPPAAGPVPSGARTGQGGCRRSPVTLTGTLTGRTSSRGTSRAAPTPICCSTPPAAGPVPSGARTGQGGCRRSPVTLTGTLTGRTSSRGTSRAAPTPICCSTPPAAGPVPSGARTGQGGVAGRQSHGLEH